MHVLVASSDLTGIHVDYLILGTDWKILSYLILFWYWLLLIFLLVLMITLHTGIIIVRLCNSFSHIRFFWYIEGTPGNEIQSLYTLYTKHPNPKPLKFCIWFPKLGSCPVVIPGKKNASFLSQKTWPLEYSPGVWGCTIWAEGTPGNELQRFRGWF